MATYEDLEFDQGSDIAVSLECTNTNGDAKDLSNHTVTAKMKRTYKSTDSDDIQAFNYAKAVGFMMLKYLIVIVQVIH